MAEKGHGGSTNVWYSIEMFSSFTAVELNQILNLVQYLDCVCSLLSILYQCTLYSVAMGGGGKGDKKKKKFNKII